MDRLDAWKYLFHRPPAGVGIHAPQPTKQELAMSSRLGTAGAHVLGCVMAAATALCIAAAAQAQVSPLLLQGMQWRNIGPFIAGKVDSVSGVNGQPAIGYAGTDNGGVWKTVNAGVTWHPVTDAVHAIRGITALAVAPSQPSIIYAGTGSIFGSQYSSEQSGVRSRIATSVSGEPNLVGVGGGDCGEVAVGLDPVGQ